LKHSRRSAPTRRRCTTLPLVTKLTVLLHYLRSSSHEHRAAGLAEALALLVFGAVIAAIVGAAALISAYRTGHPFRASAISFCVSLAIVVAGCIAVKYFTAIAIGPPPQGRVTGPAPRISLTA